MNWDLKKNHLIDVFCLTLFSNTKKWSCGCRTFANWTLLFIQHVRAIKLDENFNFKNIKLDFFTVIQWPLNNLFFTLMKDENLLKYLAWKRLHWIWIFIIECNFPHISYNCFWHTSNYQLQWAKNIRGKCHDFIQEKYESQIIIKSNDSSQKSFFVTRAKTIPSNGGGNVRFSCRIENAA